MCLRSRIRPIIGRFKSRPMNNCQCGYGSIQILMFKIMSDKDLWEDLYQAWTKVKVRLIAIALLTHLVTISPLQSRKQCGRHAWHKLMVLQFIVVIYTMSLYRVFLLSMKQAYCRAAMPLHPGPGLTQPSTLNWSVNRVPACLAGVKAECIHLCRVKGNTV